MFGFYGFQAIGEETMSNKWTDGIFAFSICLSMIVCYEVGHYRGQRGSDRWHKEHAVGGCLSEFQAGKEVSLIYDGAKWQILTNPANVCNEQPLLIQGMYGEWSGKCWLIPKDQVFPPGKSR